MDFSVKVEGLDRIAKATDRAAVEIQKEVHKALFAAGKKVEAEAKTSITAGGKTGRIYKRRTVTHQASAPGEAPASDTGRLVNSINTYLDKSDDSATVVAGRGTVKYAAFLEFGTRLIQARPFMFPALEKSKDWIRKRLADAVIQGAIKASRKGK